MKRKLVTLGYLLWAVAFFPTALSVISVVSLPYLIVVYQLQATSLLSGLVVGALYLIILAVIIYSERNSVLSGALRVYLVTVKLIGAIYSVLFLFLCFLAEK